MNHEYSQMKPCQAIVLPTGAERRSDGHQDSGHRFTGPPGSDPRRVVVPPVVQHTGREKADQEVLPDGADHSAVDGGAAR